MLLSLIATFVIGIGAAGAVTLLFRLSGQKTPGWLAPSVAGAAMFGFHLWNDYSWFERTSTALPGHVIVAERYTYRSAWQPWTLLAPRINRFMALDRSSIRRHQRAPGYVMADLFLVTRLDRTAKITQIYDCDARRRTVVSPSSPVDENGLPVDAPWIASDGDEALFQLVCGSS